VLGFLVDGSPLSSVPKRRLLLGVVTWGKDVIVESFQLEPPPPIISPVFGAHGGMDVMMKAASFVRTVSITGRDSRVGVSVNAEIIAETKPPEGWVDEEATQTQPEGRFDEEAGEIGGQGGVGGDSDAEVEQTQRTHDNDDDDNCSDDGSSEVGLFSSSSSSKSVATIPYNDVVLLSRACHNPVVKFRIMTFDTKSYLMGFFQDYFFGSDDAVDLGVRADDGYPGVITTIRKHIMTAELLPLDRMNSGSFFFF